MLSLVASHCSLTDTKLVRATHAPSSHPYPISNNWLDRPCLNDSRPNLSCLLSVSRCLSQTKRELLAMEKLKKQVSFLTMLWSALIFRESQRQTMKQKGSKGGECVWVVCAKLSSSSPLSHDPVSPGAACCFLIFEASSWDNALHAKQGQLLR